MFPCIRVFCRSDVCGEAWILGSGPRMTVGGGRARTVPMTDVDPSLEGPPWEEDDDAPVRDEKGRVSLVPAVAMRF